MSKPEDQKKLEEQKPKEALPEDLTPRINSIGALLSGKNKSLTCRHRNACLTHMFKSGAYIFYWTFRYKLIIDKIIVLFGVLKARKIESFYNQFLSWESNKDTVRFAATAGMTNFVFKVVLCALRHILNVKDAAMTKNLYAIAAFFGGLCLSIYEKGKWTTFISHAFIGTVIDTVINKNYQNAYKLKDGEQAPHELQEPGREAKIKIILGVLMFIVGSMNFMIGFPRDGKLASTLAGFRMRETILSWAGGSLDHPNDYLLVGFKTRPEIPVL
jgi:hypothetical protein